MSITPDAVAPESTPTAPPSATPEPETGDGKDWKVEAEKWKALSRDVEKKRAEASKELEALRTASMSETEKAVAEARAAGRMEALRETASRLVDAEVRTAAAGRQVDIEALLEGLDRARFIGEDGEPNTKAIAAWVDRVAPKPDETKPGFPELGQGVRSGGSSTALNGDPLLRDLKSTLGIR